MKKGLLVLSVFQILMLLTVGCHLDSLLDPDPIPDPDPGTIFSDDFSSGDAKANWEIRDGDNWAVAPDGENYIFASPLQGGQQRLYLKDVEIDRTERVYIKFDVRFTDSSENAAQWFIRLTSEAGGIVQYDIGVANLNHPNADRRGIRVEVPGSATLQQDDEWTVNDNDWYTYEIKFDGQNIKLYENNTNVFDFNDDQTQVFDEFWFCSVSSGIELDNVEVGSW